jgi:hypothetical protein
MLVRWIGMNGALFNIGVKRVARVIHRKSAVINSNNYRRPKISKSSLPIDLSVGVDFERQV